MKASRSAWGWRFSSSYLSHMAIQDVLAELNRLRSEGRIADYAIGGAVAANVYIEPADTEDIDVFVTLSSSRPSDLDPLASVYANLIAHGATWDGPYLRIGGWPVQLLMPGTDLYDEAVRNASTQEFGSHTIGRVMAPEYVAATAIATGREKDYFRVIELIKSGVVSRDVVASLVKRLGLAKRWETFLSRYSGGDE
jgi:hypothetical protein